MHTDALKPAKAKVHPTTCCTVAQALVSFRFATLQHHHPFAKCCPYQCLQSTDCSSVLCSRYTGRVQYVPPAEQERYPALPP